MVISVLGAGMIGEALMSGLLHGGHKPDDLLFTTRRADRAQQLTTKYGVKAVTSPGGTTISAIRELENRGVHTAVLAAIDAAHDRAAELGKQHDN
ncbi:pyrroline-5-carboxylate reductase [Rhodococcus erythropolis]|uniref:pyrroline-5-carboxylate reductase family protein n=1 Tax=Rhodococcus erythropolis TaxID=1833 RepID=UPI0021696024|nr:pyrroline-5-carboxylate reductase dimerization domain-containing protein [Rhodococcus erythropolis]MCS4255881.1 pyrroline-5-carboxylate reductase [Rhodococcus erythropolis]MCW2425398.1 pyrroline-5-carboxylate reductase [Rhodococcus erythropolis]